MWFHSKKNKEPKAEEKQPEAAPQPVPQNPSNINITLNTNTPGTVTEKEKKDTKVFVFKIVSVVVVLAVFATACYSLFSLFHDQSISDAESYITLQGKDRAESSKRYASLGTADSTKSKRKSVKDLKVIGNKLFLSESKITPTLYDGSHDQAIVSGDYIGLGVYNVLDDTYTAASSQNFSSHCYYLDLNLLDVGDYVVFPISENLSKDKSTYYPYSLATNETMNEMFYSLPDKNGGRKRITLKSNAISPYFLIRVENCGSQLPPDYYDAVIFRSFYSDGTSGLESLPEIPKEEMLSYEDMADTINGLDRFKVKAVSTLEEAYSTSATLSIGLSSTSSEDYASFYTSCGYEGISCKTLENTELKGYDYYPEIRELSGSVSHAGEGYSDVIGNANLTPSSSPIGKEGFLLMSKDNPNSEDTQSSNADILTSFLNRF